MFTIGDRVKFQSPVGEHRGTIRELRVDPSWSSADDRGYAVIVSDDCLPGNRWSTDRSVEVIEPITDEYVVRVNYLEDGSVDTVVNTPDRDKAQARFDQAKQRALVHGWAQTITLSSPDGEALAIY